MVVGKASVASKRPYGQNYTMTSRCTQIVVKIWNVACELTSKPQTGLMLFVIATRPIPAVEMMALPMPMSANLPKHDIRPETTCLSWTKDRANQASANISKVSI